MQQQRRRQQQRICFPGYHGKLPKAVRSSRGHGTSKYQAKQKKVANDWGIFELLATVAGEILQESDTNDGPGASPANSFQILGNNTMKYLQDIPKDPMDDIQSRSGLGRSASATQLQFDSSLQFMTSNADNFNNKHLAEKESDEHDNASLSIDRSSHVVSSSVEGIALEGHEVDTNHNSLMGTSIKGSNLKDPIIHDTCHPLASSASSGEVLTSEEETKTFNDKTSKTSRLTNSNSKHSSEVISPKQAMNLVDIYAEDEILHGRFKRKSFHDAADNVCEKSGQTIQLQYKRKRSASESSEVCTKQRNRNTKANCGSDDVPAVRLSITSFMIPELSIDLPETATVANLKRAVMDTAVNLLAGGLHVRVLHEGQKITDENTTLAQIGVTCQESLDSLEFMLEPNCNHSALVKLDEPLPLLSNVMDQPTKSWYNIRRGNIDGNNRHHVHEERAAGAVIDPAIAAEQRGIHHHSSNMQPITIVEPLIIHPGLQDPKTMEIVASQQNPPGGASKRRTRTPFTVIEVTALVQAVELLGTGRWREVKQQAFDHAKHRTYVDLKDKWKTLVHTAHIAPHQRRGEQVPQDLLDRVLKAHTFWAAQVKQQEAITT